MPEATAAAIEETEPPEEPEEELTPRDVLYYHMKDAHEKAIQLKILLMDKLGDAKNYTAADILRCIKALGDSTERAIETAAKLAPYTHPKLEAIDLKSQVEHRFVITAPEPIKSVDQWMQQPGAERLKIEQFSCKMSRPSHSSLPQSAYHDTELYDDEA